MKTLLLALFLVSSLVIKAQPASEYNGPAKITVKAFWDSADKLEKSIANGGSSLDADNFAGLRRKIDDIKRKDASFDTTPLEEKVKSIATGLSGLRQKAEVAVQANKESTAVYRRVAQLLSELFEISVQVGTYDLQRIEAVIAGYKKKLPELLALDRSMNRSELQRQLINNRSSAKHAERDLAELDNHCRTSVNVEYAKAEYYELIYSQAFWDAARQVYPEEESFKKAYDLATKLLSGLGSIADVEKIASKSKEQKIKDCRLPAAAVKDAALEKTFVDAFNKFHGEEFKGTAFKAVVTSDDWSVERNDIMGIVTGRVRRAIVVYKDKEGKCFMSTNFFIRQEYVGNSYTGAVKSAFPVMGSQQILCENAK